ncbi:MAG: hypothetical protein WBR26_14730 [Candidatus Acidiferrum sp.]
MSEQQTVDEKPIKGHVWRIFAVFCSALTCGATFLLALYRQLALVEVAASIVLGVELYFLAASIGEWIEKKSEPNKRRVWIALALAGTVVCYFLIAKILNSASGVK